MAEPIRTNSETPHENSQPVGNVQQSVNHQSTETASTLENVQAQLESRLEQGYLQVDQNFLDWQWLNSILLERFSQTGMTVEQKNNVMAVHEDELQIKKEQLVQAINDQQSLIDQYSSLDWVDTNSLTSYNNMLAYYHTTIDWRSNRLEELVTSASDSGDITEWSDNNTDSPADEQEENQDRTPAEPQWGWDDTPADPASPEENTNPEENNNDNTETNQDPTTPGPEDNSSSQDDQLSDEEITAALHNKMENVYKDDFKNALRADNRNEKINFAIIRKQVSEDAKNADEATLRKRITYIQANLDYHTARPVAKRTKSFPQRLTEIKIYKDALAARNWNTSVIQGTTSRPSWNSQPQQWSRRPRTWWQQGSWRSRRQNTQNTQGT